MPQEPYTTSTNNTQASVTSGGWAILAALRIVLAMIVVAGHWYGLVPGANSPILQGIANLDGPTAVIAFFLISGFSIAASVERGSTAQFAERRFRRIYPVYLAGFIPAATLFVLGYTYTAATTLPYSPLSSVWLTMIGLSCLIVPPMTTYGVAWSLGCEIIYYALAPWLRRIPTLYIVVLLVLSAALNIAFRGHFEWWSQKVWLIAPGLLCYWLAGWLLYTHRSRPASILTLTIFVLITRSFYTSSMPITLPISLLIIAVCSRIEVNEPIRLIFNYLGDLSYPLYVIHLSVILALCGQSSHWIEDKQWIIAPAILASSLTILHLVDYPARKHFRLTRSLSSQAETATTA